jgi:nucleotide-binding universal stress UspA family protein
MVKDILVCLEGSSSSRRAIEVAIGLALRLPATLVGLAIVDEPDIRAGQATGIGGAAFKQQRDEVLLKDAHERAQEWIDAFAARCAEASVAAHTLELRGRPADMIVEELQRHDLTVLGRHVNFRFETAEQDSVTRDQVLKRAQKPVLVVPEVRVETGPAVLVAYDESPAAERVLRSFAQSGIARDRPVHVASVDDNGAIAWETATRGCTRLRELGIEATAHNIVSTLSTAEAILERRDKLDAGLVVMGAYVQSRFSRLFWGSVTHEMLEKTSVPLFLHY